MIIKYYPYLRYSNWETLERIKRWPSLMNRFPYVKIYSAEHNAFWRGTGQGYTGDKDFSDVWRIEEAFERTKHCGRGKRIQFIEVVPPAKSKGETQ